MFNKTKVYLLDSGMSYRNMFEKEGYRLTRDIFEANLVCFTGGTDIDPELYGEIRDCHHTDLPDINRDLYEWSIIQTCRAHNIPMVGICRGAQLLCVANGGKLIQHDESGFHLHSHEIYIRHKGEDSFEAIGVMAAANHHQIMIPDNNNSIIYGASPSPNYNAEVVYWPETRSLGHQPHPEWMSPSAPYVRFFFKTINELLLNRY